MLAGAAIAAAPPDAPPPPATAQPTRMRLSEHIILRVPLPRRRSPPPQTPWRETHGPRCIDTDAIAGAAVTESASVDFVLRGGKRLRAKLDRDCPALNFYSGFYLVSIGDGRTCAERDSVHARSGGACEIERFRELKPQR